MALNKGKILLPILTVIFGVATLVLAILSIMDKVSVNVMMIPLGISQILNGFNQFQLFKQPN